MTECMAVALDPVTPGSSPSLSFPCGVEMPRVPTQRESTGRTVHSYLDTNLQGGLLALLPRPLTLCVERNPGWNWTSARMAGPPGLPFPQHQPLPQTSSLTSCSVPAPCRSPELRAARVCAR